MARTSTRNFVRGFFGLQVDPSESAQGPEVSQAAQLSYTADDLREVGYFYGGVGSSEAAVVGEHGILQIECRTPRGLLIDGIHFFGAGGAEGVVHIWEVAVSPTITGPAGVVVPLRGGALGGPLTPEARVITGTIATAAIAVGNLRMFSGDPWGGPFHIRNGRFFQIVFGNNNTAVDMGIRWRELQLYPSL